MDRYRCETCYVVIDLLYRDAHNDYHQSQAEGRAVEENHDSPRTWRVEYPPAPPAGTRVKTRKNDKEYTVDENGQIVMPFGTAYSWKGFVEDHGPLTEVVETEVEAAARRLREVRDDMRFWIALPPDARTVLVHVLDGGTL